MIAQETLSQIRERIRLSELVGETVALKRSGRQLTGLCPFHAEKTPSFFVNDEEGYFHCFGCGKKGSAFDFVMESRGYGFLEAVRFLAGRAGVELQEESRGERANVATRRRLMRIVAQSSAEVLQELLRSPIGDAARRYLTERGVHESSLAVFGVGFFPNDIEQTATRIAERAKIKEPSLDRAQCDELLLAMGLLKKDDTGRRAYASAFRERIIFPITRSDGVPIAFGGRIFVESSERPKYLNSPESLIYAKRQTFFGLSQALPVIRKDRQVYLVEGYLDVISMVQLGIKNAIATCGTAVTAEHVRVLTRFVSRTTVLFDADSAGQRAAASCYRVFLNSGIDADTILLPEGEDPNSLAASREEDEARKVFESGRKPLLTQFLENALAEAKVQSESQPAAVGRAARTLAGVGAQIKNPVERELFIREVASFLGVTFQSVAELVEEPRRGAVTRSDDQKGSSAAAPRSANSSPARPEETASSGGAIPRRSRPMSVSARASRTPIRRATLSEYSKQLVIAVLCEPILSQRLLSDLSSLLTEGVSGEVLPENVRNFLGEISQAEVSGITALVAEMEGLPPETVSERWRNLETLLERHGLLEEKLLEEALHMAQIGGTRPELMVADFTRTASYFSFRQAIEKLQGEENASQDPEGALILAQRKLETRRSLERSRKVNLND